MKKLRRFVATSLFVREADFCCKLRKNFAVGGGLDFVLRGSAGPEDVWADEHAEPRLFSRSVHEGDCVSWVRNGLCVDVRQRCEASEVGQIANDNVSLVLDPSVGTKSPVGIARDSDSQLTRNPSAFEHGSDCQCPGKAQELSGKPRTHAVNGPDNFSHPSVGVIAGWCAFGGAQQSAPMLERKEDQYCFES
jgi:hypothetical protein